VVRFKNSGINVINWKRKLEKYYLSMKRQIKIQEILVVRKEKIKSNE
jgi:hypothetical protein